MLTTLKATIQNDVEYKGALESALETLYENNDDVKSIFLDDPEAIVIGAENDPKIAELVENIPDDASEETAEITDKDIEEIAENYIPESIIGVIESVTDSAEDGDSGDDEEYEDTDISDLLEDTEMVDFIIESEIEDADDKDPKAEPKGDHFKNIEGDEQDEIEDEDDKDPKAEPKSDHFKNIEGEKQDEICDVKESYDELIEDFGLENLF